MYNMMYLTKLRNTSITYELIGEVIENLDVMIEKIYKRIGKWVEWTTT